MRVSECKGGEAREREEGEEGEEREREEMGCSPQRHLSPLQIVLIDELENLLPKVREAPVPRRFPRVLELPIHPLGHQ